MGEPAVGSDPFDDDPGARADADRDGVGADRAAWIEAVPDIEHVVERLRRAERARALALGPAPSGSDSLAALAATARASGDARGALESLADTDRGRELDRRAWLLMAGGAIAVEDPAALDADALDEAARDWIHASAVDEAAFRARIATPARPFGAVHGADPEAVALAATLGAGDLLCRFGTGLDVRGAPGDGGTPETVAARRLAAGLAAPGAGSEDAPGWARELVALGAAALESLAPVRRTVLRLRLGLDGEASAVEDVARSLGVGPDEARRVEREALDALGEAAGPLGEAGRAAAALLVWWHLTGGRMHRERGADGTAVPFASLPAPLRPVLALLGDPYRPEEVPGLAERLARVGPLTRWVHGDASAGGGRSPGTDEAGDGAGVAVAAVPLPNRLDAVVPTGDGDDAARLGALAGADRRVHLGYVVPRGSAPRERRAVEAVRLLRAADAPFTDVSDLYEAHAATFGPPGCTVATYARTLAAFPHLAVEGVKHRWAALDAEPPAPATETRPANPAGADRRRAPPVADDGEEASRDAPARTVAARLRACLDEVPAASAGELERRLGDVSRATVTGTVADDPSLRWFAPGLIAARERLDELVAGPPAALLDEVRWRLLSDALRSGERPDAPDPLFPAWSGASLEALVRWGRDEGLRLAHSRERLRAEDFGAMHSGFGPRHLAAMAIACASRDSIGWMRLNRMLGARIDSRGAIWPVVLLASLGLVRLERHWQHPLATDRARARALRDALFGLARTRERLPWGDAELRGLLGRFDARAGVGSAEVRAWLANRRVTHFLDGRLAPDRGGSAAAA